MYDLQLSNGDTADDLNAISVIWKLSIVYVIRNSSTFTNLTAWHSTQSAVFIPRRVCLSVRPSITLVYFVKRAEAIIKQSTVGGSLGTISRQRSTWHYSYEVSLIGGAKYTHKARINCAFRLISPYITETLQNRDVGTVWNANMKSYMTYLTVTFFVT